MKKGLLLFGAALMALGANAQIGDYVTTSQVWDFQAEWKAHDPHTTLAKSNLKSPGYVIVAKVGQNDRNTNKYKSYADTVATYVPSVDAENPYVPFASDPSFVLQRAQVFVSSNSWPSLAKGGLQANASDFFLGVDSLRQGDKIVVEYSGNSLPVTLANGYSSLFQKEQVIEGTDTSYVINPVDVFAIGEDTLMGGFPMGDTAVYLATGDTLDLADELAAIKSVYKSGDTIEVRQIGDQAKHQFIAFYMANKTLISKVTIIRGEEQSVYDFASEYGLYERYSFAKTTKDPVNCHANIGEGKEDRTNFGLKSYADTSSLAMPIHPQVFSKKTSFTADGLETQKNNPVLITGLYEGQRVIFNYSGDTLVYSNATLASKNQHQIAEAMVVTVKGDTLISGVTKVAPGDTMLIAAVIDSILTDTVKVPYAYLAFNPSTNTFVKSVEILTTEFQFAEPLYKVGNEEMSVSIIESDEESVGVANSLANGQTYAAKIYVAGIAEHGAFGHFCTEADTTMLFTTSPVNIDYRDVEGATLVSNTFAPISASIEDSVAYTAELTEAVTGSVISVVAERDGNSLNVKYSVEPKEPYAPFEMEIAYSNSEYDAYGDMLFMLAVDSAYIYVYEEEVTGTAKERPIAGTETYVAVVDGKLAPEFAAVVDAEGKATNIDGMGNSVVEFGTENVKGKAVGSGTIVTLKEDPEGSLVNWDAEKQALRDDKTYSADSTSAVTWTVKNENPKTTAEGEILTVAGTGIPSLNIYAEVFEGDNGSVSRAGYEAWKITADEKGNLTIPETAPMGGLYYEFTTEEDGLLSLGVWVNKGSRQTIVYDKTDSTVVSYNKEGYINGKNATDEAGTSYSAFLENDSIKTIHEEGFAGKADDQFVIGAGNQAFKGNVVINAEKGHTYLVLVVNTQLGFSGYTFKVGQENWVEIEELTIAEPEDSTNTEPTDPTEPVASLEGDIIKWYSAVAAGGTIDNVTVGDMSLAIVNDGKIAVDANEAWFGTSANDSIKLSYRLKTGGKTNASRSLTLTLEADGALYVYARTGSNSATDRNIVLTQDGVELANKILLESDTVNVGGQKLYLPVAANAKAGTITIEAPVNGVNIYGIRFVKGGTVDAQPGEQNDAIVYIKADSKVDGEVYNLAGQKVTGALKPGLYIKNGKLFMVK